MTEFMDAMTVAAYRGLQDRAAKLLHDCRDLGGDVTRRNKDVMGLYWRAFDMISECRDSVLPPPAPLVEVLKLLLRLPQSRTGARAITSEQWDSAARFVAKRWPNLPSINALAQTAGMSQQVAKRLLNDPGFLDEAAAMHSAPPHEIAAERERYHAAGLYLLPLELPAKRRREFEAALAAHPAPAGKR